MIVKFYNSSNAVVHQIDRQKLFNIDFGIEKTQGYTSLLYEPLRCLLTIDRDDWILNNIVSDETEISPYIVQVVHGSIYLFAGVIDLKNCSYSIDTEDIKLLCYDKLFLLSKLKDKKVSSSGYYSIMTLLLAVANQIEDNYPVRGYIEDHIDRFENETVSVTVKSGGQFYYSTQSTPLLFTCDFNLLITVSSFWHLRIIYKDLGDGIERKRQITKYRLNQGFCYAVAEETIEVDSTASVGTGDPESTLLAAAIAEKEEFIEERNLSNPYYKISNYPAYTLIAQNGGALQYSGIKFNDSLGFELSEGKLSLTQAFKAMLLMFNHTVYQKRTPPFFLTADARITTAIRVFNNQDIHSVFYERIDDQKLDFEDLDVFTGECTTLKNYIIDEFNAGFSLIWQLQFIVDSCSRTVNVNDSLSVSSVSKLPDYLRSRTFKIVEIKRDFIKDEINIKAVS